MPRPRRSFPAEFKAQVVLQLLSGEASQAELCRKHNIKPNLLANWKAAVLERLHTVFEAEGTHDADHLRIADVEPGGGRVRPHPHDPAAVTNWLLTSPRGGAKVLDVHANVLWNRMKKLGIIRTAH